MCGVQVWHDLAVHPPPSCACYQEGSHCKIARLSAYADLDTCCASAHVTSGLDIRRDAPQLASGAGPYQHTDYLQTFQVKRPYRLAP